MTARERIPGERIDAPRALVGRDARITAAEIWLYNAGNARSSVTPEDGLEPPTRQAAAGPHRAVGWMARAVR